MDIAQNTKGTAAVKVSIERDIERPRLGRLPEYTTHVHFYERYETDSLYEQKEKYRFELHAYNDDYDIKIVGLSLKWIYSELLVFEGVIDNNCLNYVCTYHFSSYWTTVFGKNNYTDYSPVSQKRNLKEEFIDVFSDEMLLKTEISVWGMPVVVKYLSDIRNYFAQMNKNNGSSYDLPF